MFIVILIHQIQLESTAVVGCRAGCAHLIPHDWFGPDSGRCLMTSGQPNLLDKTLIFVLVHYIEHVKKSVSIFVIHYLLSLTSIWVYWPTIMYLTNNMIF